MGSSAVTIFLGAFLLFQVQPIMGKYLLPWFGGGPGVWATCLFVFQALLLGGYAYAHVLTRYLKPRTQAVVHLLFLIAALACLPIVPLESAKPTSAARPWVGITFVLLRSIGVPYLLLASTGPLIQKWYSARIAVGSPYRLYSLSNLGSLLALISYPVAFESHLSRSAQASLWGWLFVLYCVCCAGCAMGRWKARTPEATKIASHSHAETENTPVAEIGVTAWRRLLWVLWPACASVLLLATTNKLCLDIAVFPLLWVLPLSVYLLSFVICFDSPRWYRPLPYTLALGVVLPCICWALFDGALWPLGKQLLVYCGGLLVCCLVCHGELFRLRPAANHLTEYYLLVATGGALGGLFVSLIAPLIFSSYSELHWGLGTLGALVALNWTIGSDPEDMPPHSEGSSYPSAWRPLGVTLRWLASLALIATLWLQARWSNPEIVHRSRNFYGVLTVFEHRKSELRGHHYLLQHGRITHGLQLVAPELAMLPTTYYGPQSGLGLALKALPGEHRHIGAVGLGTGTIAAYARAGDHLSFYEINLAVQQLATNPFTYLPRCAGTWDITSGDARLSLERQPAQAFDLLALDAFTSDAIPVHLLTVEAFKTYLRHLNTNGVLAVHISNHFLDLEPVVLGIARELALNAAVIDHDSDPQEWWIYSSTWVLLSRDQHFFELPSISTAAKAQPSTRRVRLWTDDFCSLFDILM